MAEQVIRTQADLAAEALAALDAAEREMDNWRSHMARLIAGGAPDDMLSIAEQARRSSRIASALVSDARAKTRDAGFLTLTSP